MMNPCGLIPPSGAAAAAPSPPQYYTIYPQDNAAFVESEGFSPFVGTGYDRPDSDADQLEGTELEEEDCVCFSPPPYEEIYALPR